MREIVEKEYFDWLLSKVGVDRDKWMYTLLMRDLHATTFLYMLPDDINRVTDGIDLKQFFYEETGCDEELLDDGCSVLEMLIAMVTRMQRDVFGDDGTDWIYILFWTMMENLGLTEAIDENYDQNHVYHVVCRWMYRNYEPNGEGSIFHRQPGRRMNYRNIPFWQQLNWYVNENFMEGDVYYGNF